MLSSMPHARCCLYWFAISMAMCFEVNQDDENSIVLHVKRTTAIDPVACLPIDSVAGTRTCHHMRGERPHRRNTTHH
ncbi:unnamed protein product [Cuscuta campestris]|uniref:Secreted protein n=1 Tax=Cuscuta campestris TaxID=132261 RepID=A0A484KLX0_9ASTE|nr:unnamed protein product [Cuscuta campestris]